MLKHLLFTFDYELFLGQRSGTVDNCIIKPTKKLLEVFSEYKIEKAIFFVDMTFLLALKNNPDQRCMHDFTRIKDQLKEIKQKGHYIFPHIHSHWIDAAYISATNEWDLTNTRYYSFSSVEKEKREKLFSECITLLSDITGAQEEMGFRAGGWCIQPFEAFRPLFEKHSIKYDFSVLREYSCVSDFQNFNFENAPVKDSYGFTEDVMKEDINGIFIEVPISTVKIPPFTRFFNKLFIKLLYKKGVVNFGDGISTNSASVKEHVSRNHEMASIELLTIININDYLKKLDHENVIHFISHQKMLSPHNIICLEVFLKKAMSKYEINTDFKKMIAV